MNLKPMNFQEACRVVEKLNPTGWPNPSGEYPSINEVEGYGSTVSCDNKAGEFLRTLDRNLEDLRRIRLMLIYELTHKCRQRLITMLVGRHESLLKDIRVEPLLAEYPILAAHWAGASKGRTPAKKSDEPSITLQNIWRI